MSKVRAHVVVWGDVQGVFFRSTIRSLAEANGLKGWVRNRPDGTVEAVFEGEEPEVRAIVEWCHQGPPRAEVESVDVAWHQYTGEFDRFFIR